MRGRSGGKEKSRAPMGTVLFGAIVSMELTGARPAPKRTVPIGAVRPSPEQTHPAAQRAAGYRRNNPEGAKRPRRMASPIEWQRASSLAVRAELRSEVRADEVEEQRKIAVGRRCFFSTSSVTVPLSATRRHLPLIGEGMLRGPPLGKACCAVRRIAFLRCKHFPPQSWRQIAAPTAVSGPLNRRFPPYCHFSPFNV